MTLLRLIVLALLVALCRPLAARAEPARPPNVILILVDDLGWRDLGSYGSTFYDTPNLDRLVARGMRFTNAHTASPLCSPTRASILTGIHPARIGMTAPRAHHRAVVLEQILLPGRAELPWLEAGSVTRLDPAYYTMAELFQEAGFATGHFGKWHLGREPFSPLAHGFDVDVPGWFGPGRPGSHIAPFTHHDAHSFGNAPAGTHVEELTADAVIDFIADSGDAPFFITYWTFGVHGPWNRNRDVHPEVLAKYIDRIDPADAQRQPVMGAMIEAVDAQIGRVLDHLDATGETENTLIVFTSDNGGVHWRAPATQGWADRPITSNAPLRGGKATIYEGGTRVPLALVWPGNIKPGTTSDALVSSVDMLPTVADLLNLPLPVDVELDGVNFAPALQQKAFERKPLFVHFPHGRGDRPGYQPSSSLIDGHWKIIRFFADLPADAPEGATPTDRYELYDLAVDLGEQNDLAAVEVNKLNTMKALLQERLDETQAIIPTANLGYAGAAARNFTRFTHDGWRVHKEAQGSARGGRLMLDAFGNDPYLIADDPPAVEGQLVLTLRMKASAGDEASVHWTTPTRDNFGMNRAQFEPPIGNQIREVAVPFNADAPLTALRLDPTNAVSTIEIDWIRLTRPDGQILAEWGF
jgi:arylsulfatase A-like enzyme